MASIPRVSFAVVVAAVLALGPAGCGDDDGAKVGDGGAGPGGDGSTGTTSLGDGGAAAGSARVSESVVAGVMIELYNGQSTLGNLALTRAQSPGVKSLAQKIATDHVMAFQRMMMLLQKLGLSAGDSDQRRALTMTIQTAMSQLSSLSGAAFDTAYAKGQVDLCQLVLRQLDELLIPSAQNPELKAELATVRGAVAMHLTMAQAAAGAGGSGGGADASAGG